jgi:hypothetical protein
VGVRLTRATQDSEEVLVLERPQKHYTLKRVSATA